MVEGAKADRRRPPSTDRALLARLLMGKGGAGRSPSVHEGKRAPVPRTCPEEGGGAVPGAPEWLAVGNDGARGSLAPPQAA